jgi:hypothetical protein
MFVGAHYQARFFLIGLALAFATRVVNEAQGDER